MAETRIRGEQVQFRMTKGQALIRTMTAVKSLTLTAQIETTSRGYLNETTERKDEIYKGVTLDVAFDVESPDAFDLIRTIVDRAKNRTFSGDVQISCTAVFTFPGGIRRRITIPDVKSGPIPIAVASREEYVGQTLSLAAGDFIGPSQ